MATHGIIKGTISTDSAMYIGDICYVLEDDIYDEIWGGKYHYEDGVFETEDGWEFAVAGTAYGDGVYADTEGNHYGVDAGVIGIVPIEIALADEGKGISLGRVIHESGDYDFYAENGVFTITTPSGKRIEIDTRD